ncbi:transposase [Streptomyces aureoverticillatus]|nr:transposase [Streptomyces aureoverticillatus]
MNVQQVQRPPGIRGFRVIARRRTIERGIGWLMHHRRLARYCERHLHRSEVTIHLAMMVLNIRTGTRRSATHRAPAVQRQSPRSEPEPLITVRALRAA